MICPRPLDYQVLALGVRLSWLGAPSCVLKLCALLLGVGVGGASTQDQPKPCHHCCYPGRSTGAPPGQCWRAES